MLAYTLRRLLYLIPTLFGVALILFVIFNVVPGDPVFLLLPKHASLEQVASLRHELGLDRPLVQQFLFFLKQIVTFDYGRSFASKQQISTLILRGMGPSLILMIPAYFALVFISIVVSLFVAYFRGRAVDKTLTFFCVMMMSVSYLAYIIVFQYVFAYVFDFFPISGYDSGLFAIQYVALPVLIYVTVGLGPEVRFNRTIFLDEMNQDYVKTARAKGVGETVILFKHVLKNSMIPIITQFVIAIPFLFLGSLLLENFFGIPGLGSLSVDAIYNNDLPIIKAVTMIGAILFMGGQLVSDLLYAWVDPRIQLR